MAIQVVCAVNNEGKCEVIAIEPMLEESTETYNQLFKSIQARGLKTVKLVVSDAQAGLVAAIRQNFPGSSWQRCKVHFMRNILAHIPQYHKDTFANQLKLIWQASSEEKAVQMAKQLLDDYEDKFPKVCEILEEGLIDSLAHYSFPCLDKRKVSSTNMLERLNVEIRRRTRVVGVFPNPDSYTRLVSVYLIECTEDWLTGKSYLSQKSIEQLLENE